MTTERVLNGHPPPVQANTTRVPTGTRLATSDRSTETDVPRCLTDQPNAIRSRGRLTVNVIQMSPLVGSDVFPTGPATFDTSYWSTVPSGRDDPDVPVRAECDSTRHRVRRQHELVGDGRRGDGGGREHQGGRGEHQTEGASHRPSVRAVTSRDRLRIVVVKSDVDRGRRHVRPLACQASVRSVRRPIPTTPRAGRGGEKCGAAGRCVDWAPLATGTPKVSLRSLAFQVGAAGFEPATSRV